MMVEIIKPYKTLGIIGGNIEAYHLTKYAKSLGFEVGILSNQYNALALQLSDWSIIDDVNAGKAYRELAERSDFVIYTEDNFGPDLIYTLKKKTQVPQDELVLNLSQDRLLQKAFFESLNVNIFPYEIVFSKKEILENSDEKDFPKVLKTNRSDKSYSKAKLLNSKKDLENTDAFFELGPCLLEGYDKELRNYFVTFIKTAEGEIQAFPIIQPVIINRKHPIFLQPAYLKMDYIKEISRLGREIVANIDFVGALTIKVALSSSGSIYVEEIQSSISDTARITNEFFNFSIYEAQLKAITNLPLPYELSSQAETILIPLFAYQLQEAYKQMEQKIEWRFEFYNNVEIINPQTEIGYIILPVSNLKETIDLLTKNPLFKEESA